MVLITFTVSKHNLCDAIHNILSRIYIRSPKRRKMNPECTSHSCAIIPEQSNNYLVASHIFCTPSGPHSPQTPYFECPCSVDDTRCGRYHTRQTYHLFFPACDRSSGAPLFLVFLEHSLCHPIQENEKPGNGPFACKRKRIQSPVNWS